MGYLPVINIASWEKSPATMQVLMHKSSTIGGFSIAVFNYILGYIQ